MSLAINLKQQSRWRLRPSSGLHWKSSPAPTDPVVGLEREGRQRPIDKGKRGFV